MPNHTPAKLPVPLALVREDNRMAASTTPQNVVLVFTGNRRQERARLSFDPASRTLIVPPDLDLKIRKALVREVGKIKLCLRIHRARLRLKILLLKARCVV